MKTKRIILYVLIVIYMFGIIKSISMILSGRKVVYIQDSNKNEIYKMISGTDCDYDNIWKISYGTSWLNTNFKIHILFDKTREITIYEGMEDNGLAKYICEKGMKECYIGIMVFIIFAVLLVISTILLINLLIKRKKEEIQD